MLSISPSIAAQAYLQAESFVPGVNASPQDSRYEPVPPVQPISETVSVSNEARELSRSEGQPENAEAQDKNVSEFQDSKDSSFSDQNEISKLKARDLEVRAHEQAHLTAAGPYSLSQANFTYQRGPDGQLYAVGGEVAIDVGKESSPEATIAKMQTVRRAALAPANPSSADRQIAAQATVRLAEAQREIQADRSRNAGSVSIDNQASIQTAPGETDNQPDVSGGAIANRRILMADAYKAVNELL